MIISNIVISFLDYYNRFTLMNKKYRIQKKLQKNHIKLKMETLVFYIYSLYADIVIYHLNRNDR